MSKNLPKKYRIGRGSLFMISTLLFGSALIRIGSDAGQAFAKEPDAISVTQLNPSTSQICVPQQGIAKTLAALQERDQALKILEMQMQDRMKTLSITDVEVSRKLVALEEAEAKLRATLSLADSAAEDDIGRLVAVYENMKPKDAASVFEQMDPQFSAGFLARMRPDAAAGVMAGMTPESAYSVSVILAGRNASVPTE